MLHRSAAALLFAALLVLAPATSQAQERSSALPRASTNAATHQTIGVTDVGVTYGRPSVKGRDVFGGLVPYGEVWRTGANEATTITFADDVEIEGQSLDAGTYGLFTIPGEEEWTIIFNDVAEQWGAYEYDEGEDVLRVSVEPTEAPHQHEQMTFHFADVTENSATAALAWDDVRVPFRIETDTEANVRARAEAATADADDWRQPLQYAAYALQNDLYPEAALTWADRSIAMEENFQNVALKARLLAAMERYDEAREHADRAMQMAEGMDEAPRGLEQFEEMAASWQEQSR